MSTGSAFAGTASSGYNPDDKYELPPAGNHPAVLVALIDLGTHAATMPADDGTYPDRRSYLYAWELTGENDSDGDTFVIGESYTASMSDKANQRKMIQAWINRNFFDGEEFDPVTLVGKECLLNVSQSKTKKGKDYAKVAGVGPVPRGMTVPKPSKPLTVFHLSMINSTKDMPVLPDWLPRVYGDTVKSLIESSREFAALGNF